MPNQGNNEDDIWRKNANQGPPDLIAIFKKFFGSNSNKAPDVEPSGNGGAPSNIFKRFVGFGLGGIFLLWVLSGIFILGPKEQSVILRFGKYVETVGPGSHWIPPIIEQNITRNVQQIHSFVYEAEMLTEDENIVVVPLTVQYRIGDLNNFLFNVVDPLHTVKLAASSALRQEVGHMPLDDILTTKREKLRNSVRSQLQSTLALYKTGIIVKDVTLQKIQPPTAVMHAFDDAIKAREDKQRFVNQAQTYARKVSSRVVGQVASLEQAAEAYKEEVILRAQGDVARYLALLTPYLQAPAITRERLYFETVSGVLAHTHNILVDAGGNNVLYLPLSQMMRGKLPPLNGSSTDDKSEATGESGPTNTGVAEEPSSGVKPGDINYGATQGYSAGGNN